MGERVDDALMPITDAQLDALWDSVTESRPQGEATDSASASAQASCYDLPGSSSSGEDVADDSGRKRLSSVMLGVKAGDSSFEVEGVEAYNKKTKHRRILPEDGTWVDKDAFDPGDRFGPQWRGEEVSRQKILEADPNYQFITLVAGATNTTVERLYDEDSVGAQMRRKIAEQQALLAGQETKLDINRLGKVAKDMAAREKELHKNLGKVSEQQRTSQVLGAMPQHQRNLEAYVSMVRKHSERVDETNLLEFGCQPLTVPASNMDRMGRIVARYVERDDDTGGIDEVSPKIVVRVLLWKTGTAVRSVESGSVTDVLQTLYSRARPEETAEEHATLLRPGVAPGRKDDPTAATTLCTVLTRLTTLAHLRSHNAFDEEREEAFAAFLGAYNRDTRAALDALVERIDGEFSDEALRLNRLKSWVPWLDQLDALTDVFSSALNLLEKQFAIDPDPPEKEGEEGEEEEGGGAALFGEAEEATPDLSYLLDVGAADTDSAKQTLRNVREYVGRARGIEEDDAAAILRAAHVFNSPALADDLALQKSMEGAEALDADGRTEQSAGLQQWEKIMGWYEGLGAKIFTSLTPGDEDTTAFFPADANARLLARESRPAPEWNPSVRPRPPPNYTIAIRNLWDRYVVLNASAIVKIAEATSRRVRERPSLTAAERIIFTSLRGGLAPEDVRGTEDPIVDYGEPVLFAARLHDADLKLLLARIERDIESTKTTYEATQGRIRDMARGLPVVRSVTKMPYEHRRGWVEQPEHSGVVRLVPIVTQGIAAAWNRLQRLAPNVTEAVDVEFLQHDPQMRPDFADLVAVEMAIMAQRFPKQYIQLGQRTHTMTDLVSIIQRFRKNFELHYTPSGSGRRMAPLRRPQPTPGRDAQGRTRPLVAHITPTGEHRRSGIGGRGGMVLF